jgi:hypothetical protein
MKLIGYINRDTAKKKATAYPMEHDNEPTTTFQHWR